MTFTVLLKTSTSIYLLAMQIFYAGKYFKSLESVVNEELGKVCEWLNVNKWLNEWLNVKKRIISEHWRRGGGGGSVGAWIENVSD